MKPHRPFAKPWYAWVFTGVLLLGYLLAMFVFYDSLPEQWSFDSSILQDLMSGGTAPEADSFAATAKLLGTIPESLLQTSILLLGCFGIVWFAGGAMTLPAGGATAVLLTPVLLMGLLRPQKEVLVVAMSFAVLAGVYRARRPWFPLLGLGVLYAAYGFYVRPYYLLILAVFGIFYSLPRWPKGLVILAAGFAICVLWLLPTDIFLNLQGVRDDNNFERVLGELGNRTFFFNPFYPGSAGGFTGNYAYAAARLNMPVLFSFQPQEIFLNCTTLLYALLVFGMLAWGNWRARFLACLFAAHMVVLWLFEPDLGSYLRHASSAVLYLGPGLVLWQKSWVKLPARHPLMPWLRLDYFDSGEGAATASASRPRHAR